MRIWGLKHMPAGLGLLLAVLVLAVLTWFWWTSRIPPLPPKLAGAAPVLDSDLPEAWRGLEQERLAQEVMLGYVNLELQAAGGGTAGGRPATWQELLLGARYLGDGAGIVRALNTAADAADKAGQTGWAIELAGMALAEAQRYKLDPAEVAACYGKRAYLEQNTGLLRAGLRDYAAQAQVLRAGNASEAELHSCLDQIVLLGAWQLGEYEAALALLPEWERTAGGAPDAQGTQSTASWKVALWAMTYRGWGMSGEAVALLDAAAPEVLQGAMADQTTFLQQFAEYYASLAQPVLAARFFKRLVGSPQALSTNYAPFHCQAYYRFLMDWEQEAQAQAFMEDCVKRFDAQAHTTEAKNIARLARYLLEDQAGACQLAAGNYHSAKAHFERELKLAQAAGSANDALPAQTGLAMAQCELGEYQSASQVLAAELAQAKQASPPPPSLVLARLWLLRGRIETGLGQLDTAQRDLNWVAGVLRYAPRDYWAAQRELKLAQGELAEKRSGTARARQLYQAAFDAALKEARALSYNAYFSHNYTGELRRAQARLAPLLKDRGDQAGLDRLSAQLTSVEQLRALAQGQYQALSPAARECLQRYRTAQTRAQTLANCDGQALARNDISWNGWWRVVIRYRGAERKRWLRVWAETRQLHHSLTPRIAAQQSLAAQALSELQQLDPPTAALLGK